jgi:hypothetical protein
MRAIAKKSNILVVGAGLIALALSSLVSSGPRVAWALQAVLANDVFSVNYIFTRVGDNTLRIVNPTTTPNVSGVGEGRLCAMIYVFDAHEQLQECCGCPVTDNGIRTFNVMSNLLGNTNTNPGVDSGVLKVVSALENVTCPVTPGFGQSCAQVTTPPPFFPCNAAGPYTLAPTLRSWIRHTDQIIIAGVLTPGITEEELADAPLDANELSVLQTGCAGIHSNSSGRGQCTCGAGDVGLP